MKLNVFYLFVLLTALPSDLRAEDDMVRKPNLLHIHADDFRPDCLHALGHPLLKTPNLDLLVERGTTFTHCYTQGSMIGAVCLPSRTMLLTGRSWLRLPAQPRANAAKPAAEMVAATLPKVIGSAGYETWHMGKSGNEYRVGIAAFDTNIVDDGRGGDRRTSSRRHADAAVKFLAERKTDRPFYIDLAPPVPHDPRIAEPEYMKMYSPEDVKLSPSFLPQHPFDNGEMSVRDEQLAPWPRTKADTQKQLAEYYACISCLDHHVGRILNQLKTSGQLDKTIVIFTGDNGLSMGDHGLFGKQNLYEFGGMHVPLVLAGPGIPKGKSDAFVYLMDLFPTLCEFAGATVPEKVEGKSLVSTMKGKESKVRDVLYTGYRDGQRSVRDDRGKLIRYPLVNRTQLFDLQTDPHELTNVTDKPDLAAKVREMTAVLKKEMDRYADAAPLTVANPKPAEWTPPAKGKGTVE